jgi:hypothetical protein
LNTSWNTTFSLFALNPNQTAKWPVNVGPVGVNEAMEPSALNVNVPFTKVKLPVAVPVPQTSAALFIVKWKTLFSVTVTMPSGTQTIPMDGKVWTNPWTFTVHVEDPPELGIGVHVKPWAAAGAATKPRNATARQAHNKRLRRITLSLSGQNPSVQLGIAHAL